jgi:uncharacterized protein (DUF305 family)
MAHNVWHIFIAALFALGAAIAFGQKTGALADSAIIVQPGAPGESSKTLTTAPPSVPARVLTEADVKFMQGMIHHHSQAVEMTDLLRTRGRDKNLQELGKRISISQTDEIQFMRQWLQDRGKPVPMEHMNHMAMTHEGSGSMSGMDMSPMPMMPGMLSPQQMDALAKATGRSFDRLFLTGMIQHHRGALVMVQDLFETAGAAQDNVLYDFATDIDNTQRAEIDIMQRMLKEMK